MNELMNTRLRKKLFRLYCISAFTFFLGCGPATPPNAGPPATAPARNPAHLTYTEITDDLEKIVKEISAADQNEITSDIDKLKTALAQSFPLLVPQPFSLHSLQDLLMKATSLIKDKSGLITSWKELLTTIEKKSVINGSFKFPIDTSILRLVLAGDKPKLVTTLHRDFSGFSADELDQINRISLESFWQPASLYPAGARGKRETGAIVTEHDGEVIAILEFKNEHTPPLVIDESKKSHLAYSVAETPGYVASVGRLAAYARFGLGETLFRDFFTYAKTVGLTQSYLHVRANNLSAISLYERLGYKKIGEIVNYYSNPPSNALVMKKIL